MQPVRPHEAVEKRSRAEGQQQYQKQCRDCHAPPICCPWSIQCWSRTGSTDDAWERHSLFPLWRLHSGPQSSSVDQYSETPPEHLASTVTEAMRRSVVTRHCLSKKIGRRNGACAPCWVYYSLSPLRFHVGSRCVGGHRGTFSAPATHQRRAPGGLVLTRYEGGGKWGPRRDSLVRT